MGSQELQRKADARQPNHDTPTFHVGDVETPSPRRALPLHSRIFLIALWIDVFAILFREFTASNTVVYIGSYGLTFLEVILATSLAALIVNVKSIFIAGRSPYLWVVLALTGILLFNFARGFAVDPFAAFVSLRSVGPLITYMLLAAVAMRLPGVPQRLRATLVFASATLALLALFRRTTGLLQTAWTQADGRPIGPWGGLLVTVGCILLFSELFRPGVRPRLILLFLTTYLGMVATGQGTANLAALAGFGMVFLLEPGRVRLLRLGIGLAVSMLVAATLAFMPNVASLETLAGLSSGSELGSYIGSRENTSHTRELIWEGIWSDYPKWSSTNQLLGLPSGMKPYVVVQQWGGVEWNNSAHSMYMQTLINQGMIGFWLYILLTGAMALLATGRAFVNRTSDRDLSVISVACGGGIVVAVAVFSYSYDLGGEMAPLLMTGFACALAPMRPGRRPRPHRTTREVPFSDRNQPKP